jgi:hypothetical protein
MSLKRAFVYVDEKDRPARLDVEKRVTKVLARYPNSLLVEADDAQIKALKTGGREVELKTPAVIRLRTLEFDPAQQLPQPPAMLSRAAPKAVRPEKQGRDFWIVQFVGPVQEEWRDKVRALGGKVHGHVPDDAFIVEMTLATKQKLEKLAFVNWIGPYEPAYKLSPLLAGQREKFAVTALKGLTLRPERFKPTPLGNIRVTVHNPARARKVAEAVAKLGGKVINSGPGVLRVMLDISKVHELAKLADVKWIEPAVRNRLFNDVAAGILNVQQVRTDHGLDGDGQIVGVADTGLDNGKNDATLHEDFKGRVVQLNSWAIPSGYSQYLDNTSLDDGAADKDSGHGTHVAGSVLGNGTKSSGAIQGMAPAAKLVQLEDPGRTAGVHRWLLSAGDPRRPESALSASV